MAQKADIIEIPIKVKSRNVLDRQHWAVKRQSKKEYGLFIRNQMRLRKIPLAECKKYSIVILSYRKKKLDYDNLVGGCKHLIDALIDERFIHDDSPDYIDIRFEQHISNEYNTIIIRR
jgi:Holliday junction resolvase RusA-like endonuclease